MWTVNIYKFEIHGTLIYKKNVCRPQEAHTCYVMNSYCLISVWTSIIKAKGENISHLVVLLIKLNFNFQTSEELLSKHLNLKKKKKFIISIHKHHMSCITHEMKWKRIEFWSSPLENWAMKWSYPSHLVKMWIRKAIIEQGKG